MPLHHGQVRQGARAPEAPRAGLGQDLQAPEGPLDREPERRQADGQEVPTAASWRLFREGEARCHLAGLAS